VDQKALLVPQQALQRTADGQGALMVVKDGKVVATPVTTGAAIDGKWLITSGLSAGDVVVVEGFQKIRPGAPVQPMPWNPNQGAQGGQPGQAGQPGQQPGQGEQQPGQGGQAPGQDGQAAGEGAGQVPAAGS